MHLSLIHICKGYEVLDRNWSCEGVAGRLDLVAMDEDAIVFIDVTAANREEGGFSEGNLTREQFELLAATWLEGYTPCLLYTSRCV